MAHTILIAEYGDEDCWLLKQTLSRAGILNPIFVAGKFDEAMAYVAGKAPYDDRKNAPLPGIAFVDFQRATRAWFDFSRALRASASPDRRPLLIATSASSQPEVMKLAYDSGADHYITKPFRKHDVELLVTNFPSYWRRQPNCWNLISDRDSQWGAEHQGA